MRRILLEAFLFRRAAVSKNLSKLQRLRKKLWNRKVFIVGVDVTDEIKFLSSYIRAHSHAASLPPAGLTLRGFDLRYFHGTKTATS